jgi:hypothetical protein
MWRPAGPAPSSCASPPPGNSSATGPHPQPNGDEARYANDIHHHLTGTASYPLHPKLTNSPVLARLYATHGTYLCPQAYPEGCPTHPAYPGATATIGGAGVRVLQAFFNPTFVIPDPVVPSDDGRSLRPWTGEPLTVGGELNKLAFNMAFGRDTAGVHFRRDEIEGIVLGEWYRGNTPAGLRPDGAG